MLEDINKNGDIKKIPSSQLNDLAKEIRRFLVKKVSVTGGHLAANLGVVELTIALHRVFNFDRDKIVWDVGHQSYVHKILTGRKDRFDTLRQHKGLSGFPKRAESVTDCFDTGHSSNSVSAGMGMVVARDLRKEDYSVVSVIGDGAATGGMFFEALNNAGKLNSNFIIVLNDNEMSISRNFSGTAVLLSNIRTMTGYNDLKEGVKSGLNKVPLVGPSMAKGISAAKAGIKSALSADTLEMLFENLGITYLGPVDGHNIQQLEATFRMARRMDKAVLIHVVTQKGRGYRPAELHPDRFHGIGPFDRKTGQPLSVKQNPDWTDVFSDALCKEAKECPRLTAITAAMPDGTGLKQFGRIYPGRTFDVGIAEGHAVTFAAGQAVGGLLPVVAVYSTFLQRAYDQILEDVCLQKLHVIFAIDRAGIVGQDGETHQGVFDGSFLAEMPGLVILSPKDADELRSALHFAIYEVDGPVAVRYGRGEAPADLAETKVPIELGKSERLADGSDVTIIAVGGMNTVALAARDILKETKGIDAGVINARFIKPMDLDMLKDAALRGPVVILEENELTGGFGERVEACLAEQCPGTSVLALGIRDQFVPHGKPEELLRDLRLDPESVAERITGFLEKS